MNLKFYWVGNNTSGNFGDVLTPKILDYYSIPYTFQRSKDKDYNAICIGSILRHAKDNVHVFGSGFMSRKNKASPNAIYHWVRGPESRKMLLQQGIKCPEVYGDPAMIMPLMHNECKKEYDIGIIPHVDHYKEIKEKFPNENVIRLHTNNALDVVDEITKCRKIISSSLHGIIVAHAYNIPAAWVNFGAMKGDGIKFDDHYNSIGLEAVQSTIDNPIFTTGTFNPTHIQNVFKNLKGR